MSNNLRLFSYLKSDFFKNIVTLLSGASIAQVITLISVPILTRLFTPEDFGYFALYLSLANIFATVSTGRYELAIMLPKEKKDALAIFKGTVKIIFWISFASLVLIFFAKNFDSVYSDSIQPFYFYFLPASIFILGLSKLYSQWFTREKDFLIQVKAKVIQSGVNSGVNVVLGFFFFLKSLGLFFGHILSQILSLAFFYVKFKKTEVENLKKIKEVEIKSQLKLNKDFPLYSAPMGFLNTISVDVLIYVLNLFYSTSLVGLYTNANKVVNYPLNLISQSFTSVFYQKISETNKKVKLYVISLFFNLGIAILAMIPIVFWGEEIFSLFLGKEWIIAGTIAKYLAPLTIASFAVRSVSHVFSLTLKNKLLLVWQVIYLIVILCVIFVFRLKHFEVLVFSVSVAGAFLYFVLAIIGYHIMRKTYKKEHA